MRTGHIALPGTFLLSHMRNPEKADLPAKRSIVHFGFIADIHLPDRKKPRHMRTGVRCITEGRLVNSYQSEGPFSAKAWTRKSMKARTLGCVKRPGG